MQQPLPYMLRSMLLSPAHEVVIFQEAGSVLLDLLQTSFVVQLEQISNPADIEAVCHAPDLLLHIFFQVFGVLFLCVVGCKVRLWRSRAVRMYAAFSILNYLVSELGFYSID